MIKVLNVVGARPQIIKASAINRAIKNRFRKEIKEVIIHTGQHYDRELSSVFFDELKISNPQYNLNTGSASHSKQTASIMTGIEELILKEQPDCIIVYGDTNSTMATALAASKLHCPVIHIEAGLRSYNKSMPEEINRIITDHVSSMLFSPTNAGFKNLINEGFRPDNSPPFTIDNPKIYHSGDIMYDNALFYGELALKKKGFLDVHGINPDNFALATIHRENNTEDLVKLESILAALRNISIEKGIQIVLPLHPRTTDAMERSLSGTFLMELRSDVGLIILPPVPFLEFILLERNAKIIITDSGGVQKEAHFFEKPCIILRKETEWVELVDNGTSYLANSSEKEIMKAFDMYINGEKYNFPKFYGDGKTAEFICEELIMNYSH